MRKLRGFQACGPPRIITIAIILSRVPQQRGYLQVKPALKVPWLGLLGLLVLGRHWKGTHLEASPSFISPHARHEMLCDAHVSSVHISRDHSALHGIDHEPRQDKPVPGTCPVGEATLIVERKCFLV